MTIKKAQKDSIQQSLKKVRDIDNIINNKNYEQVDIFIHSFADFLDHYKDIEQIFEKINFYICKHYEDENLFISQIAYETFEIEFVNLNTKTALPIDKIENIRKDITRFINFWQENSENIRNFLDKNLEIDFLTCNKNYRQQMLQAAKETFYPSSNVKVKLGKNKI